MGSSFFSHFSLIDEASNDSRRGTLGTNGTDVVILIIVQCKAPILGGGDLSSITRSPGTICTTHDEVRSAGGWCGYIKGSDR